MTPVYQSFYTSMFIATTFKILKKWPSSDNVSYVHNTMWLSLQKYEIMLFMTPWVEAKSLC